MLVLPTTAEVKTFLQIQPGVVTHDALIASLIPTAVASLERLSGRKISSSSNQETVYSTDGASMLVIHDRPFQDPSRTVTLDGTALTLNQDVWFLQDRRDVNLTTMVQLRAFSGSGEWWKSDPEWFNKNLDIWAGRWGDGGMPNNLSITGIIGMPFLSADTWHAIVAMTGHMFKAKDAQANIIFTPEGEPLDLSDLPSNVQQWLMSWRIRTAVAVI